MGTSVRVLGGGNLIKTVALTDGTTPSLGTGFALTITGEVVSANIQRQDTGQYDVSVDHVQDNQTLQTYLNAYIDVVTSSAIGEVLFEDGVKEAASSSSNPKQLILVRGGLVAGASTGIRKLFVGPQRLKSSSGAYQQTAETWNHVSLEFEGFKLGGALTVGSTYLTGLVTATTPTAIVLSTSLPYGTVTYE